MIMALYVTTINITALTTPFPFITTRSTSLSAINEMQFINMRCLPYLVKNSTAHQLSQTFEASLVRAIRMEILQARTKDCYYHFCRFLYRKVQELGLHAQYQADMRLKICKRKFVAFGFLSLSLHSGNLLHEYNFDFVLSSNKLDAIQLFCSLQVRGIKVPKCDTDLWYL